MNTKKPVAVIGSGPAGLMCAHVLSSAGVPVTIFEKRPGSGRKILVAGSSGLNVSFDISQDEFLKNYQGPSQIWEKILQQFSSQDWIRFIQSLGLETFRGTSGRFFVKDMKGANLLHAWVESLKSKAVEFRYNSECIGFQKTADGIQLDFNNGKNEKFAAVCFAVGGGSWEKTGTPVQWPQIFISKNLEFKELKSANCGFEVDWPKDFLKEAEGMPLKEISLTTARGTRGGEIVITPMVWKELLFMPLVKQGQHLLI